MAKAGGSIGKPPAAEYLQANMYINHDDAAVTKMADEAAGDAKTPYEIADRLRVFVSEKIEDKNLNVGFASASEVCRNMSGDCSEHGVLLAALGRAKGIPSQVACGLVYVPHFVGTENVFGFHMWTQFWIDGQWVDFDAAQNESDCNPTHIAVITDSLQDGGLGELAFAVLPMMARLKIEVIEVEPASAAR
jgi:transglutaminase-like putative cysteine protease